MCMWTDTVPLAFCVILRYEVELASTLVWRRIPWADFKKKQLSWDVFKTKQKLLVEVIFQLFHNFNVMFRQDKNPVLCAHMPVCIFHLYYNGWHCVPHCPVIFCLFSTVIVAKETRCYGNIMTACTQPARKNDDVTLLPREQAFVCVLADLIDKWETLKGSFWIYCTTESLFISPL